MIYNNDYTLLGSLDDFDELIQKYIEDDKKIIIDTVQYLEEYNENRIKYMRRLRTIERYPIDVNEFKAYMKEPVYILKGYTNVKLIKFYRNITNYGISDFLSYKTHISHELNHKLNEEDMLQITLYLPEIWLHEFSNWLKSISDNYYIDTTLRDKIKYEIAYKNTLKDVEPIEPIFEIPFKYLMNN